MRCNLCALALLSAGLMISTAPASAGFIIPSAVATSMPDIDGMHSDCSIILTNASTSTDPIGTFWFAWTPGQDYMANSPFSITSPAGWTAKVTHGGAADGYAIQWVAGAGAAIPIGGSLTFAFVSLETPAQLAGKSAAFPGTPEMTSVVYNGAPFSADSANFAVTPSAVPEPSAAVLSILGGLSAFAGHRLRNRARA